MRWLTFADSIPKSKQMSASKDDITTSTLETRTAPRSLASRSAHRSSGITTHQSVVWFHVLNIAHLASCSAYRPSGITTHQSVVWFHVLNIAHLASCSAYRPSGITT
eukprot:728383_1